MRIFHLSIVALLVFLSCKENKNGQKDKYSADFVEVLGPKGKGIFDSVNVPNHLKNEIKGISKLNYFDSGVEGKKFSYNEEISPFTEFLKLKSKANIKELYQLTFNKNQVVSLYSYIAVAERIPELNPIFYSRLLNIKDKIYSENGCLVGELHPSEIFYNEYLNQVDEDQTKDDKTLRKLDSISVFNSNATKYVLNQALRHRIYPECFQKRFEELAFERKDPYALLYMSKNFRERYKGKLPLTIISYLKITANNQYQDYSRNALILELMKYKNPSNKNLIEKLLENNFILKDNKEVNLLKEANGILK